LYSADFTESTEGGITSNSVCWNRKVYVAPTGVSGGLAGIADLSGMGDALGGLGGLLSLGGDDMDCTSPEGSNMIDDLFARLDRPDFAVLCFIADLSRAAKLQVLASCAVAAGVAYSM